LDSGLVLWFPGPGSYTGEDAGELHLHGGAAVIDGVLDALAACPGLRLAEPGEFTRRAFERGRLDLAQAEAIADLIDAETQAQRRQALDQLGGALSRRHETWRGLLLDALAWLEASVDFPDEDLPELLDARVSPVLRSLERELTDAIADAGRGRRIREGYRIALIGPPNAGKSTLLNALIGREAAIVTSTPGTTRDVIEAPVVWNGHAVLLADTAGLREAADEIEAEGVRRAGAWATSADLRLWVVDGSERRPAPLFELGSGDIVVANKADLGFGAAWRSAQGEIEISARRPADVDRLRALLAARVASELTGSEFPSATRRRHAEALAQALASVRAAQTRLDQPELAAEEVQTAARMLQRVAGHVEIDAVLERVFSAFCIGK
jgi:tRNA modification GTPase